MKRHTHIGVYGILAHGEKMLLVQKHRGPYTGRWDLPRGGVEMGETSTDTLGRELREECGFQLKEAKLADVRNSRVTYINGQGEEEELTLLSILYEAELEDYELPDGAVMLRDEDVSASEWFRLDEIDPIALTPMAGFAVQRQKSKGNL